MFAKRFFYASAGILCLALAYHFGATSATAQAPGNPVVGVGIAATQSLYGVVVTANGDVYTPTSSQGLSTWSLRSNIFSGPIPTRQESFGSVKARYR